MNEIYVLSKLLFNVFHVGKKRLPGGQRVQSAQLTAACLPSLSTSPARVPALSLVSAVGPGPGETEHFNTRGTAPELRRMQISLCWHILSQIFDGNSLHFIVTSNIFENKVMGYVDILCTNCFPFPC